MNNIDTTKLPNKQAHHVIDYPGYPWSRSVSWCLAEDYGNEDQHHSVGPCGSGKDYFLHCQADLVDVGLVLTKVACVVRGVHGCPKCWL